MSSPPIRVLLIDDDVDAFRLTSDLLASLPDPRIRLEWIADYDAALKAVAEGRYDAYLVDFDLGSLIDRSGLDLLRQVDAHSLMAPIILLTGVEDDKLDVCAMSAGAADYLVKHQITPKLLERSIRYGIDRKRALAALRDAEERLSQKQRLEAVGALAGGISHEFNNLLQVIQGYARFVTDDLDPKDPRRKDLEQVLEAADRAVVLTRQLLSFSRKQTVELKTVSANQVIKQLLEMLKPIIGAHIDLSVRLMQQPEQICADANVLSHVLMNLCLNARDAMPDGGRLVITTSNVKISGHDKDQPADLDPGSYVKLAVSDTGCGMPTDVLDHIFEPFFTTKDVGQGTGLGLSMAYGAIEQHGGHIAVSSQVGEGTRFDIYLPVGNQAPVDSSAEEDQLPAVTTPTILVAEDEPMVRNLAVRLLQTAGYETLTASDGQQAIDVYRDNAHSISLLMLDMVMPKLNGREVYEQIGEGNSRLPVVFCTGYHSEAEWMNQQDAAGFPVVHKPYDNEQLLQTIRELLSPDTAATFEPAGSARELVQ